MAAKFCGALGRKKSLGGDETKFARVLNLLDLTALGVGSTLGVGVYVLAGSVARNEAGPAACLSFLVAAIASGIAGICYAEFASRVPKAGSAYVYCYVTVGEFSAFIIGWNLILEYVIGTASVARALSNYIDSLTGKVMQEKLTELFPININFLSDYPDFLSFAFVMVLTMLLVIGVKESTFLNNIFTILNLLTVITVIVVGIMNADVDNWKIEKEKIPPQYMHVGDGGFLPFGFAGVMAGAAKCFYGYVGFDCVATTGEEAKNPQKDIPLAIILSLLIIFGAYFGISTVLTMMWPYYDQDPNAPFPYVLDKLDYPTIKLIVTVGAIFALCTSMLGAMFPLPRVIYAMSEDGLLYKVFSKVHEKTKTPIAATILSGILSGIMAALFDLQQLIDMMSIGTLLAYTIVAICVLILRYVAEDTYEMESTKSGHASQSLYDWFKHSFNVYNIKVPNLRTSAIVNVALLLFCLLSSFFCASIIYAFDFSDPAFAVCFILISVCMLFMFLIIYRQPTSDASKLSFKVPLVPLIPCASIIFNVYLMMELDLQTWIRFIVWLVIGFVIYFGYGIRHSEAGKSGTSHKSGMSTKRASDATASVHSSTSSPPTHQRNHDVTNDVTKF